VQATSASALSSASQLSASVWTKRASVDGDSRQTGWLSHKLLWLMGNGLRHTPVKIVSSHLVYTTFFYVLE